MGDARGTKPAEGIRVTYTNGVLLRPHNAPLVIQNVWGIGVAISLQTEVIIKHR